MYPGSLMKRATRAGVCAVAVLVLVLGTWSPVAAAPELTLSVAISMKEAIEEIGRAFRARHPDVVLRHNLGASGELQKQIEAGAPIDVFVSAGERQMDELQAKGLIIASSRRAFARNVLTVIKPVDSPIDIAKPADLVAPRVRRVVIGDPRTVPVGQYSEESLRALGLWERLQPRLVLAANVRQALEYVARGEVDAGVVYATDVAARGSRVKEAFRPPGDTYRPVVYPVALVAASRQPVLARAFLDLLLSTTAAAVLARLGFQPPPAGAR